MEARDWMMALAYAIALGSLGYLVFVTLRSVKDERTPGKSIWKQFGLGLTLMLLFFSTWIAHAIAEWQTYSMEEVAHGNAPEIGDYLVHFAKASLENWQSEFLQLFSFVTLAALYMFKGSAESKDGEEKIEASLRRIEENLGTLPDDAPKKSGEKWRLPDAPPLKRA